MVKRWNKLRLSRMLTRLSLHFSRIVKVHCKDWHYVQGAASSNLLPLFHSAGWYILLTSKKTAAITCSSCRIWSFLHKRIPSLLGNFSRRPRLTKPKETVPGHRPGSPSMLIVNSSDFILDISRLIEPVSKESLLTLLQERWQLSEAASAECYKEKAGYLHPVHSDLKTT